MSSNGTGSNGRSAIAVVDESTAGPFPFGDVGQQQLVRDVLGDSEAALAGAAVAIARVEQNIDRLWRESMTVQNRALSERLAEVSHALRLAARLLEGDHSIR